jgi:hypothetical protein
VAGWQTLLDGWPWFRGEGAYPLPPYSEFMPPPRLVRKPYGTADPAHLAEDDPWGWPVTEYEEALTLRPGLEMIARHLVPTLARLGRGDRDHGIGEHKLTANPYWPDALAEHAGKLTHERYVTLMPLALSWTQDDKARIGWTLFGGSEQGPARAFWRGFFTAPGVEAPEHEALSFVRRLLGAVYGEPEGRLGNLRAAGFRILPAGRDVPLPFCREGPLPSWTRPYLWARRQPVREVKYLLTFKPFGKLPAGVRRAYLAGDLHLLPFPGSLIFWGARPYFRLRRELPFALQIPLLPLLERHEGPHGIRIPQSGWLYEDGSSAAGRHGRARNTYKRTHRYQRVQSDHDSLTTAQEDQLAHVLFGTDPDTVGLYNKPQARNSQIWTGDFRLLLDGPHATPEELRRAGEALEAGGTFGYRFLFPAMQVGRHQLYWHRPLVAYLPAASAEPVVLADAPLGYLTAYDAGRPDLARPVELWPRLLRREPHRANVELFARAGEEKPRHTLLNVRKLLEARQVLGWAELPRPFAHRLLTLPRGETLDGWLEALPETADDPDRARRLADELCRGLGPHPARLRRKHPPEPLTFRRTTRRSFEVAYWKTVALLSTGDYRNKNNADCILDPVTQAALEHHTRDLEPLAAYLLTHHTRLIADHGLEGKAVVGELPFRWQTEFDFPWMGGWLHNQEGRLRERDLVVVIPGRDRSRAVLMADHYDTAYMSDRYEEEQGGDGARLPAPGADDNGSATAALLLGAPVFMELSRQGRLGCDVWLVHLTGEEFPAEGLGARRLSQALVEGNLRLDLPEGDSLDLSDVRVEGVYVLDMIGHNGPKERDVFQISPGVGREALWLAYQAHVANELWNAAAAVWNRGPSRRGRGRGRRSRSPARVPPVARFPRLRGEVRPHDDPRSTLYNSDARMFADAGVPAVLLMENYDIDRSGYHDSHDTMANLDLDYAAALAAIAIEAVARAATEPPP